MLMQRTQIYIDQATYAKVKARARTSGKTISELIRITLASALGEKRQINPLAQISKLSEIITFSKETPKNLSTSLDRHLYQPK